jgi:hypothetical protein
MHVSALAARKDGSQKQSERTRTRIPQIAIVGAGFVGCDRVRLVELWNGGGDWFIRGLQLLG